MKYLLFFLLFFSLTLPAQQTMKKAGLQKMIEPKVSLESSYLNDAELSAYDSSVEVQKNRLSINNKIAGFSYTSWNFKWDDVANLPFGDGVHSPIEQMHSLKLNANLPYFVNEQWFILSSVSVKSTFEKETSGSYGVGLFSFASYKLDDDHSFQMGAFANYHPTSTLALPVVSYSYRARQTDGFRFILGFPRTYVGYHLNKELLVRFGVIFSQSVIRLSDESVIAKSGFIEAKDYMGNFGVSYDISPNFTLQSDILYGLKRDFIIYSKDSELLDEYSIKPSFGVNFKLTYIF